MEWVRRLSVELLKESPSPALRSCWALANIYNPLARFDLTHYSYLQLMFSILHSSWLFSARIRAVEFNTLTC